MTDCALCSSTLGPVLGQGTYWKIVLNHNQNLLGKTMLVLQRHAEPVIDLSTVEWAELQSQIRRVTLALQKIFNPDHFNYAFLQNQDRHVHMHVIPRYAGTRSAFGMEFDDPDYPSHYSPSSPARRLSLDELQDMAELIARSLESQRN